MLSKASVRKPYTVLVAVILIIVLGIVSFTGMSTDLLPNIELPYVVIITAYPGASPEKVELTVTRPLEAVLGTASGLNNISSISSENSSMIILEFIQDVNMDSVMIELSGYLDQVGGRLDSAVASPLMMKVSPDMLPVMVASIDMPDTDLFTLSRLVRDEVVPAFERIDGVASVAVSGLLEQKILVTLDAREIDGLNRRLLADINRQLDEKEAELTEALDTLQDSKTSLESALPGQQAQLVKANSQVNQAIGQLQALLAEEASLSAQREAFEQEKHMLLELTQLKPFFDQYFPDGVLAVTIEQFQALLEDLTEQLLTEEGLALPDEQISELLALSQEEMADLSLKILQAFARLNAIEIELQNLRVREMTLQAMKPQLEKSLREARSGAEKLDSGKITLAVESAKAQIQLEQGLQELDKAADEFDKAREEAVKQANIASVINNELLSGFLMAQHFSMPAGSIQEGLDTVVVKVGEDYASQNQLEQALLLSHDVIGDVRLVDVATVKLQDNTTETYAKINGNNGIVLTFQKQSTASTADVTRHIHEVIGQLESERNGLRILPLMDQGKYIEIIISSVLQNLLIGGILAILILMLFLRDPRPTLVIAISIPVSLLFALTLMYFTGVSINIISLSGLALGIGMLVDNSVVVIENIYRMRHEGVPPGKAAVEGARQVSGAIVASTLTTICVFLPIVFTQGLSRQLFTDMGLTIAYSLLASLAVALSVVPALSATALRNNKEKNHRVFSVITRAYSKSLAFSLRHKYVVLIPVVLLFALSLYSITIIGTAFIPEIDSPQMSATLVMPDDSDADTSKLTADQVSEHILTIDAVAYVGAMSGGSSLMGFGSGGQDSRSTSFYILLQEKRDLSNHDIEREISRLTEDLPGEVSVSAANMNMGMLGDSGITVQIRGQDFDMMGQVATEVIAVLQETDGIAEVVSSLDQNGEELRIIVDKDKAMRYSLTVAQIYQKLATALQQEQQAIVLTDGIENIPVLLKPEADKALTRENLGRFVIEHTDQAGVEHQVQLNQIARIETASSLQSINRENQSRYLEVSATLAEGHNIGLVSRDLEPLLQSIDLPTGISLEISGENAMIHDALGDLFLMLALAVLFIYLIMVAQFQSLLSPFIVLFTLPLAFTGGQLLLWILGMELSVIAALGFLVLAGVVVNNGIVFVSTVNQLRENRMERKQALLETGVLRLRPILMTAFTTILAMITMAAGFGQGAEMTQPMAVVTIGGLLYATVLTLYVVPLIYDVFHKRHLKQADVGDTELDGSDSRTAAQDRLAANHDDSEVAK